MQLQKIHQKVYSGCPKSGKVKANLDKRKEIQRPALTKGKQLVNR